MLQEFANTLRLHRSGLLAYYDCPITTGPLEGTNNKIKTMQRQAYGFRDQRVLQTQNLRPARNYLRISRMNPPMVFVMWEEATRPL